MSETWFELFTKPIDPFLSRPAAAGEVIQETNNQKSSASKLL